MPPPPPTFERSFNLFSTARDDASPDSREVRIVRWPVEQDRPRRTYDLANDLGLTRRAVPTGENLRAIARRL